MLVLAIAKITKSRSWHHTFLPRIFFRWK